VILLLFWLLIILSFFFLCFNIHLSCKSNSGLSEKWGRVCFVSFSTFSVLPGVVWKKVIFVVSLCVQHSFLLHYVHFGAHAKLIRTAICGFGILNALAMKCGLIHTTYICRFQSYLLQKLLNWELASKYPKQGFKTLKLKVGKNPREDVEVLQAIRAVHPDCLFILDANEGYKPVSYWSFWKIAR